MTAIQSRPLLAMEGVSLPFGDRLVFQETDWIFARNQQWAVVGANGSGKSLFARALAGKLPVVRGEIRYNFRMRGRYRWRPEAAVAQVSFEQQKLYAGNAPSAGRWFSLENENAATVRQFLSKDSVEDLNPFEVIRRSRASVAAFGRRLRRVLRLLAIASLLDRSLLSLSNGEMRKVLLARALLRQPRLLVLDDPFTGLDVAFRAHLKAILEVLMRNRSFHLLLIVSHPDELPRGITHVLCVDRCKVVAQGSRPAMLKNPWVRRLFGGAARRMPVRQRLTAAPAGGQSATAAELVYLKDVTVRYGQRAILQKVDWTVRRGEHWAVLGPNGSGKSTLLSVIIGDHPQAYANTVRVFGRQRGSGVDIWSLKRRIGHVSPELHLHFPATQGCLETVVSGLLDTNGCLHPITPRQRRVARQCLARLGLADYEDSTLGSLSAGLQRMVLLARALVKSPDLLVLDEPCQGLDLAHRVHFLKAVDSLIVAGVSTVIYVTHRQDEIPRGVRRVLRLKAGFVQ